MGLLNFGVMNARLWGKAYMLEFIDSTGIVQDVFTFSVPPESESFTYPQRISETKTFGGSIFDDYGNDTIQISLRGTTINNERKLIFQGNGKSPAYKTGEEEAFMLQELFSKWGGTNKLSGKKVYLYDLSKMSAFQKMGLGTKTSSQKNYWRVVCKNLKINRDKSRPFTFSYEMEFSGVFDGKAGLKPSKAMQGKLGD